MPMPSARKVRNIVISRPSQSDTQPNSGRLTPFIRLLSDSAKSSAGAVTPSRVTASLAIPKPFAVGAGSTRRLLESQCREQNNDPLQKPKAEESRLISVRRQGMHQGQNGQSGSGSEPRRRHARGQSPPRLEPFERVSYASPIHQAGPDSADHSTHVEG